MRYILAWLPLVFLMIGNGVLRELGYGPRMGELQAHQVSTVIGIVIYGFYTGLVFDWLGVSNRQQAWTVGLLWLVLTVVFEFGFGRYIAGHSWGRLLKDYNLLEGRVWALFLAWVAVAPWAIFRLRS